MQYQNKKSIKNPTKFNTDSFSDTNLSSQQQQQYSVLQPLNLKYIHPANEIISANVKGDNQIKIMIKSIYDTDRDRDKDRDRDIQYNRNKNKNMFSWINNVEEWMCFQESDCLGYQYQGMFAKGLVYARLLEGVHIKKWINFMTYSSTNHQNNNNSIKYMAGLFTHPDSPNSQLILKPQKHENPQHLTHNLSILSNTDQKNYQQQHISFSASSPSSNLMYVFQAGNPKQYELILHNDTNSKGSTQWFNFSITLTEKYPFQSIVFNIINLTKRNSLYLKGMKVLVKEGVGGWKRLESEVFYKSNKVQIEGRNGCNFYSTLSFKYDFNKHKNRKNENETISFSYGYPYGFQDHFNFWNQTIFNQNNKKNRSNLLVKKIILGYSSSGLPIQVYKVSGQEKKKSFTTVNSLQCFTNSMIKPKKPKTIVFLARQHSGQTQGSFIMEGIVNFLVTSSNFSNSKKFIYYFFPIVNPEGVLLGNYRTNVKGYDLNRNWRNPILQAQPEIIHIKRQLHRINKQNQISLIIDLHGHSKSFNSFFYGVQKTKGNENPKIFPYFCSKKMRQISYNQSFFTVSEQKKNTARVVLSEMFPKSLVYTLQSSFYGYKIKQNNKEQIIEYNPSQLRKLGSQLISTFLQYSQLQRNQKVVSEEVLKKQVYSKEVMLKQIEEFSKELNIDKVDQSKADQSDQNCCSQSDSEAEQELIDIMDYKSKRNYNDYNKQNQIGLSNKASIESSCTLSQQQRPITKASTRCEEKHKQKNESTQRNKSQGRYLKTIQMIEAGRRQFSDEFFIHKMGRNSPQQSESRRRTNFKYTRNIKMFSQRDRKISNKIMPMLLISMMKTKTEDPSTAITTARIDPQSRSSFRNKCLSGIKISNEPQKQVNYQDIGKRLSYGIGVKNKTYVNFNDFSRSNLRKLSTCKVRAIEQEFRDFVQTRKNDL